MKTFIPRLAVAVIPFVVLVASVIACTSLPRWSAHRPLAWHRSRRSVLRALAGGLWLR